MEIILLLTFILGGSFPFLVAVLQGGRIVGRTVKVVKANLNSRKQRVPGIVTPDMRALEPRNKDWGPDGKLTQMWEDAFDYWSLKDPEGTLESYRFKQYDWEQRRNELKSRLKAAQATYEVCINRGNIYTGANALVEIRKAEGALAEHGTGPDLTRKERIVERLVQRYGSEVYYNNDMVRLSAQNNMPTFDYIALTSV